MALDVSILDLATVPTGAGSAEALGQTIDLARFADQAGFSRFWVAEHHNMASVASTSPPVFVAEIAARTERIRVGSGGVMLPNHAPFVVAEQFSMLEALHPGRIDLGLGRAPGTDAMTASALRRSTDGLGAEEFPQHVLQLLSWLGDRRIEDPMVDRLAPTPQAASYPEVWLLGSSGYSAQLAGMLGLPYCYAGHFGGMDPAQVFDAYRARFEPSAALEAPHAMLCTSVLSADTAEEADHLAGPARRMWLNLHQNRREPVLTPEQAEQRPPSLHEDLLLRQRQPIKVLGTHEQVAQGLRDLVEQTGVQELMITSHTHDVATKIASYGEVLQRLG